MVAWNFPTSSIKGAHAGTENTGYSQASPTWTSEKRRFSKARKALKSLVHMVLVSWTLQLRVGQFPRNTHDRTVPCSQRSSPRCRDERLAPFAPVRRRGSRRLRLTVSWMASTSQASSWSKVGYIPRAWLEWFDSASLPEASSGWTWKKTLRCGRVQSSSVNEASVRRTARFATCYIISALRTS